MKYKTLKTVSRKYTTYFNFNSYHFVIVLLICSNIFTHKVSPFSHKKNNNKKESRKVCKMHTADCKLITVSQ